MHASSFYRATTVRRPSVHSARCEDNPHLHSPRRHSPGRHNPRLPGAAFIRGLLIGSAVSLALWALIVYAIAAMLLPAQACAAVGRRLRQNRSTSPGISVAVKIGRESGRERECQDVSVSVGDHLLK